MIAEPEREVKAPRFRRKQWASHRPPKIKRREVRRGTRCLNCGTETREPYCHQCGQENVHINISIWEIFSEAIQEFAQLDSKFVRTLIPLLIRPGMLTQEWAAGRRVRYVSPLRLYLTITAGFFLLISLLGATPFEHKVTSGQGNQSDFARMEGKLPEPLKFVVHQISKVDRANGQQLGQAYMSELPTAIFIMLPLYAGVLWVLYCRNQRFYVEHLVFALHCHAFYFIDLSLIELVAGRSGIVPAIMKGVLWLALPVYSVAALKRNYMQPWWKTLFKSMMLGYAYAVLLACTMFGSLIAAAAQIPDSQIYGTTSAIGDLSPSLDGGEKTGSKIPKS